jgi:hypothetical protein
MEDQGLIAHYLIVLLERAGSPSQSQPMLLMQTTQNVQAWAIATIILVNANVQMASKAPRVNTSLVLMIATATGNANLWQRLPEAMQ